MLRANEVHEHRSCRSPQPEGNFQTRGRRHLAINFNDPIVNDFETPEVASYIRHRKIFIAQNRLE